MSLSVRWLLLALPVALVAFVTLALVTGGTVRPYRVARVWGGPTDGRRVSVRVEGLEVLVERAAVVERPLSGGGVVVELHAPNFDARRAATLDSEGSAEVAFELPSPAPGLQITVWQGEELARGTLALDAAPWVRAARRRGGWASARAGDFQVRAAPLRGAFAVPFRDELAVDVLRAGAAASGVRLHARGSGATVEPETLTTDPAGRATFSIEPHEHVATVTVTVDGAGGDATASFALPIVPGALDARRSGETLTFTSPVPREVAYFALVTETERLLGGRVTLTPSANGAGASASVPFSSLQPPPKYVVVSSERDLRSPAAVGWPLDIPSPDAEPARTFDAVDALLVDGRPRAAAREARRAARVRWVVAAVCGAMLALELVLLVMFTRNSDRSLDAHFAGSGLDAEALARLAPKRVPRVALALILVALGFLVVAAAGVVMAR
jgi:hypothetical protein